MSITSSEVIEKGIQRDGRKLIQLRFTDHTTKVHILPTRLVAADFDVDAELILRSDRLEKSLAEGERSDYIERIRNGENPFRDGGNPVDPVHQTRPVALKAVLRFVLRLDAQEVVKYTKAIQFMDNVTDAQFTNLLGFDATRIARVRQRIIDMLSVKSTMDTYTPEMGADE